MTELAVSINGEILQRFKKKTNETQEEYYDRVKSEKELYFPHESFVLSEVESKSTKRESFLILAQFDDSEEEMTLTRKFKSREEAQKFSESMFHSTKGIKFRIVAKSEI